MQARYTLTLHNNLNLEKFNVSHGTRKLYRTQKNLYRAPLH
jgi:hypothetical protein